MNSKWTVRTWTATFGLVVPATMALALSADTSFRFMGTHLRITNLLERGVLCGTAEASIVALCLYSWATRTKGPAWLAYTAVLIQSVPAFEVSGGYGGVVRTALGPVLLAVLLHLLLGLELRLSRQKSSGLMAQALREVRERTVAYFGIGRRGEDSASIARSRAADRAVTLVDKVAAVDPRTYRHARRRALLAEAIDKARHGLDAPSAQAAEDAIVARVVRRKSVAALATINVSHDWTLSVPGETRTVLPDPVPDQDTALSVGTAADVGHEGTVPVRDNPDVSVDLGVPDSPAGNQDSVPTVSPVRRTQDGSMRSVARAILLSDPDTSDADLSRTIKEIFGQDSKPNSVNKSISRARQDIEGMAS